MTKTFKEEILAGYEFKNQLYRSEKLSVFRAIRLGDSQPVLIQKTRLSLTQNARLTNQLRHEYDALKRIDYPGIIRAVEFIQENNHGYLILIDDNNLIPLKLTLEKKKFEVCEGIRIILDVAKTLCELHARGTIHRNISSSSIYISEVNGTVKLGGLSLSTTSGEQIKPFSPVNSLTGNLAYISPEQTGRVGRYKEVRAFKNVNS